MDIKEKYDEYEYLMFNLKEIIEHTKLKGYKEELQQMLYYAEDEFKEVEEAWNQELGAEWEQDEKEERNREYREMVGF